MRVELPALLINQHHLTPIGTIPKRLYNRTWRCRELSAGAFLKKLVLFILISSFPCFAKESFVYGYIHFPPLAYTEDGQAKGILIDRVRKILAHANLKARFIEFPLPRVYEYLKSGEIQITTASPRVKKIKDTILWNRKSVYQVKIMSTNRKDSPLASSHLDYENQRVAADPVYDYIGIAKFLKNPVNKVQVTWIRKIENGLKLLRKKRVNYLLSYNEELKGKLPNTGEFRQSILREVSLHFIVSKKVPNAEKTLLKLKKAQKRLGF